MDDDTKKYLEAKERVTQIKDFYSHSVIYIAVSVLLFLINISFTAQTIWFQWPLLFWGVFVAAHYVNVFAIHGALGRDWEENKIKELMKKR